MKYLAPFVLALFMWSCSGNSGSGESQDQSAVVSDFLTDVSSFEDFKSKTPIKDFAAMADDASFKSKDLDKDNVMEILSEARAYTHVVIIVEDHTLVRIVELKDCKQSGSWGACMPKAEGYIKKGDLVYQNDYINNIIGRPDDQKRTVYMFK
ncbi:hypothetical protein KFE98_16395 [bacterium SCSIO 12741]|nr:hypothetical protein KFE98_16395 [bacterium SCSIO 12741]